ncbi:MAG: TolC family protein [Sedimentibacter sp.]
MKFKKLVACTCIAAISISAINPVYAQTEPVTLTSTTDDEQSVDTVDSLVTEKVEPLALTQESAVKYGLEHNKSIEILENKIQLALVASQNAATNSRDLRDAKELLRDAENELFDSKKLLSEGTTAYNYALSLLEAGCTPEDITLEAYNIVIPAGSNILDYLTDVCGLPTETAEIMTSSIEESIEEGLTSKKEVIDYSSSALDEAETTLEIKQEEFKAILEDTSETIDTKISYGSLISLDADDASKLMIKMAGVNLDVTKYAKDIYRNQIAMLIEKNYYDALYAEKMYDLKKIAKERGEKQYNMIKLSYENGMKAKDDFLLSKMYYDSTIISCRLAEATYKNALFELKKNMNIDMNTELTLEDSMLQEVSEENLENGLNSGLTNRIEIRQSLGQLVIYELNESILNSRAEYRSYTKGLKEATLLREGAEMQLDQTKQSIKSEVNQSYETMIAAGEMLESSNELVENAEEVVAIAKLKYEQGFGAENSLLKQMNLQESSGTIIELVAAQEKLSEIEAQVAQIRYGYTMARIKYLNDSGILIY